MADNPYTTSVPKVLRAAREVHGAVTTTVGGRMTELDADAPSARVNTGNGGNCELRGGGQTIAYNQTEEKIAIQRGKSVVAILNPRTAIGVTVDGQMGTVEIASTPQAAKKIAASLNEGFVGERLQIVAGTSGDIAHIRQAMQEVGLYCTDKNGTPTGLSLTPKETANLVEKAVKGR